MKIWKFNFGIDKVRKEYEKRAVSVSGMVGSGKDLLTANVIERRKLPHISNCPYNKLTMPYKYEELNCGENTYKEFIRGTLNKYNYPYFDGCDIYLSDCGIYFPSQYCNELNREYKNLPTFMALTRQLGECHVHFNAQNINRVWDKIREMSDIYYYSRWVKLIKLPFIKKNVVIQLLTRYEFVESCIKRIKPCRIKMPLLAKQDTKNQILMYKDNFTNLHGSVRNRLLIYINKAEYDSRFFKTMLKLGKEAEKNEKSK